MSEWVYSKTNVIWIFWEFFSFAVLLCRRNSTFTTQLPDMLNDASLTGAHFGVNTGKDECRDEISNCVIHSAMKTLRFNFYDFEIMRTVKCERAFIAMPNRMIFDVYVLLWLLGSLKLKWTQVLFFVSFCLVLFRCEADCLETDAKEFSGL